MHKVGSKTKSHLHLNYKKQRICKKNNMHAKRINNKLKASETLLRHVAGRVFDVGLLVLTIVLSPVILLGKLDDYLDAVCVEVK